MDVENTSKTQECSMAVNVLFAVDRLADVVLQLEDKVSYFMEPISEAQADLEVSPKPRQSDYADEMEKVFDKIEYLKTRLLSIVRRIQK